MGRNTIHSGLAIKDKSKAALKNKLAEVKFLIIGKPFYGQILTQV